MRRKIYLKNSFYSVINYSLLILLSFVVRRALVLYFPIEYTGYEALFTDIFTLLSIADLGMDSIITYHLYERIAEERRGIVEVIDLAKKMYRVIAIVVLGIGCIIFFILPFLFSGDSYDLFLIRSIYILQVFNLSLSYLTGYKRLLLIADQKEYICLQWDSVILIFVQISRMIALAFLGNYYIYVGLCIVQTLGQNIGISIKCNKEYKNSLQPDHDFSFSVRKIKKDLGNFLCHRISAVVYSATDNIVITSILGLITAGLYSNYYMIAKYTYSFATKIMKPMQASIGNYLYSKTGIEEEYKLLLKLNGYAFLLAAFVCNSLIQLSTPFVRIWLGESYIQEQSIVILLAINYYIAINQDFIYYFRNSFGEYEYDKKYMIMSAMTNLVLSIFLSKFIGLEGIIFATIAGHIFIWYGRVKFVYVHHLKRSMKKYWYSQIVAFFFLGIQLLVVSMIGKDSWIGIKGCILREGCVIFISFINFVLIRFAGKNIYKKDVQCE